MKFDAWTDEAAGSGGGPDLCTDFQVDLSCLVDGELEDHAAGRAMLHLEQCELCRDFFEDTRRHARLHRDMADPERLFAHVAALTGGGRLGGEGGVLVQRLATIFYQLGKAYTLAAIDPGFCQRIFEAAVPVDVAKDRGRGFVDGVLLSGKDDDQVDWRRARNMLNGRLERIEDPLEKGRRLLEESLHVDPGQEEAQLYLAFIHTHENKRLKAAEEYRRIFDTSNTEVNRGLAIVQLGLLHSGEEDYRRAASCFRWVTMTGLADSDDRFWFTRFNLGMVYARWQRQERALTYFRELLDRHPTRLAEVVQAFAHSPKLRQSIDSQAGFAEALARRCPELLHVGPIS